MIKEVLDMDEEEFMEFISENESNKVYSVLWDMKEMAKAYDSAIPFFGELLDDVDSTIDRLETRIKLYEKSEESRIETEKFTGELSKFEEESKKTKIRIK
jgi:hypothetical protein